MSIAQLNIHQLRNISSMNLKLHARYNVIYGQNGSGKTSLLEAIYLLCSGKSFRTHDKNTLIQYGTNELTVFARTVHDENVSIHKTTTGPTRARLKQQACLRSSELMRFLPCQLLHYDIFNIIDAGPSVRRQLLDWGLFHVKPSYVNLLSEYRHVLLQRNALLRKNAPLQHFHPWDKILIELAEQLDILRSDYVLKWQPLFQQILYDLTDTTCVLEYYKGWGTKQNHQSLSETLRLQWQSDCQRQYTQSGAHHADLLLITSNKLHCKKTFSRGQQKIILFALKLAQAHLIMQPCIYLFDDVFAELDQTHIERLVRYLQNIPGQFIFTAMTPNSLHTLLPEHYSFVLQNGISI